MQPRGGSSTRATGYQSPQRVKSTFALSQPATWCVFKIRYDHDSTILTT